jgi:hypothetical protein
MLPCPLHLGSNFIWGKTCPSQDSPLMVNPLNQPPCQATGDKCANGHGFYPAGVTSFAGESVPMNALARNPSTAAITEWVLNHGGRWIHADMQSGRTRRT